MNIEGWVNDLKDSTPVSWRTVYDENAKVIFGNAVPDSSLFTSKSMSRLEFMDQVELNVDSSHERGTVSITCMQKYTGCFEMPVFIYSLAFHDKRKIEKIENSPNDIVTEVDMEWVHNNLTIDRIGVVQESFGSLVRALVMWLSFEPEFYVQRTTGLNTIRLSKEGLIADVSFSTTGLANAVSMAITNTMAEDDIVGQFFIDDTDVEQVKALIPPSFVHAKLVNLSMVPKPVTANQPQVDIGHYGNVTDIDEILPHTTILTLAALGVRRIKTTFYPHQKTSYTYLMPRSVVTNPKND